MDISAIRKDYPILQQEVHKNPLVYLDNAATMQMPKQVMDCIAMHYQSQNANVHRGVHTLSQRSTNALEDARKSVAAFIGAATEEVIFTSGCTQSLNDLAHMLESRVGYGQQVLVSAMEHHSNLVPWQDLCNRTGASLKIIPIDENGDLDLEALHMLLQEPTAVISVCWVSNVLGTVNPIGEISMMAHEVGAYVVVDGAQAMKLGKIDLHEIDCDFFACSGHKIGAMTGVGILYGKRAVLETMGPIHFGGGMVDQVSYTTATYGNVPQRFEAGTPHYVGAISMDAALTYMMDLGIEDIAAQEERLTQYILRKLEDIPEIHLAASPRRQVGAVSFTVDGVSPFDAGVLLDAKGIAVRTGHLCAQPLIESLGLEHVIRVSPAFYNTKEEIDLFLDHLNRIISLLKGSKR